jgi:hypothetical protein
MHNSDEFLFNAGLRILKYLYSTRDFSIVFRKTVQRDMTITGYSDSSYGDDNIDAKSTSGYFGFMNGCLVSWQSSKQPCITKSSTAAEYVALNICADQCVYLKNLLTELTLSVPLPITIFGDNMACMSLTKPGIALKRLKHLDIRFHYIRELVESGLIKLVHIGTDNMVADVLTKPMTFVLLKRHLGKIGFVNKEGCWRNSGDVF